MASTSLLNCLPEVFTSACLPGSPLAALVAAADGMHQPIAAVLDDLDAQVDPFRASEAMVAYLAGWVDLGWLTLPENDSSARSSLPLGTTPLRDLISASAELAALRGTAAGLVRFLELATRVGGFVVEDAGLFHVRVLVPEAARGQVGTVERIVSVIKPAHVTAEMVLAEPEPAPSGLAEPGRTEPGRTPADPAPADSSSPDPTGEAGTR